MRIFKLSYILLIIVGYSAIFCGLSGCEKRHYTIEDRMKGRGITGFKFAPGDLVKFRTNGQKAVIVKLDSQDFNLPYKVRYHTGSFHTEWISEFEIEKVENDSCKNN